MILIVKVKTGFEFLNDKIKKKCKLNYTHNYKIEQLIRSYSFESASRGFMRDRGFKM